MKKVLTVIAVFMVIMLMLVGCNNQQQPSQTTPVPSAGTTTSSKTLLNAINPGDTYRYFVWSTVDENDPFRDAGVRSQPLTEKWHAYEAEKGITIEYVKSSGGHNWFDLPRSSAAAGEPICDIFDVGGPFVVLGTAFYNGQLGTCILPISDYADYGDFSDPEYWDQQSQDICTFSDKLYCVVPQPYGAGYISNHNITLFNNDIMKEAGYSIDSLYEMSKNGQWTWDEFKQAVIACTNADKGVYGTHVGDNVALGSALIVTNGGHYFESTETGDVFVGNKPNAVEAWDFIVDLSMNYNAVIVDGTSQQQAFSVGKVAMMVTSIAAVAQVAPNVNFGYGIINPPKGPRAQEYISEVNWFTPISVMNGANNPAGCVQLLSEYCKPEYAMNSKENAQLIEAELSTYLLDQGSMETAMNITKYTSVENYFLYQTVTDGSEQMLAYLYGNVWRFVSGDIAPKIFYDSIKPKADALIQSVYNIASK